MSTSHEACRADRPVGRRRSFLTAAVFGLFASACVASAQADSTTHRLFIQVWWDSPSVEMDAADDPGRIEVYVGEVFIGCAVAPSHLNYRRQLMLVPPAFGFTGAGNPADVRVIVTGQLGALPARRVKITEI